MGQGTGRLSEPAKIRFHGIPYRCARRVALLRCGLGHTDASVLKRIHRRKGGGFSFPAPLSLQQIVKLELLADEEPARIKAIWADYHAAKDDAVATTLSGDDYKLLKQRAKSAPYFIIPVNRRGGFFNMLCQFQDKCFLVTYLEAFKENPALAPPCLTVSLFDDLLEKKDVGLVRVDIVNMLDKAESEKLLSQLVSSYSDEKLFDWVDKFNNRPNEFDFEAYHKAIQE